MEGTSPSQAVFRDGLVSGSKDSEQGRLMSTDEQDLEVPFRTTDITLETEPESTAADSSEAEPAPRKLELDVEISDTGPCKKHLKVTIPKSEIDRQFDESLGTMLREVAVPGFRQGHAPRRLVQKRFRKEVSEQVKAALLVSAMEQLEQQHDLKPISQPNFDPEAVELREDEPLRFELDIEVRPEFGVPEYKGLTVKRPVKEVTDSDVDARLKSFLESYAQLVPKSEGGAEIGDYITGDIAFLHEGRRLNEIKEAQFRLQPVMIIQDGQVPQMGAALTGARPGETREAEALVGSGSSDPGLRGQSIQMQIQVHDLKQLRLPEVDGNFLKSIGFDSETELREALHAMLERRNQAQQRLAIRRAVMDQLLEQTRIELPTDLVARQEQSTIGRVVMEMRQGGLTDAEIRAREAEIRANAHETTLRSLKEFFILAKIADAEQIKVEDEDIDHEIEAMAARTDESPRRVRGRLSKEGQDETLAVQILERKTLDLILKSVQFEEVPFEEPEAAETLDETAASPVASDHASEEGGTNESNVDRPSES